MSKSSDVHFGRRGGHEVPTGTDPGNALADIDAIRRQAIAEGTWPADSAAEDCDGQLGMFE